MYILVLYYSRHGSTRTLAHKIAAGINSIDGVEAMVRTVPPVAFKTGEPLPPIPDSGDPYVTLDELRHCCGLALGSPTRFGNMAAPLKHFIDSTSELWVSGALIGKPFCVFTSSSSLHGGQETTLLSMALPLIHHGMLWVGVPYSVQSMMQTKTGGSPYGASCWMPSGRAKLSQDEADTAYALGQRLAHICKKLGVYS